MDPTAVVLQRLPLLFAGVVHWLLPTCDQNLRRRGACPVFLSAHSPFQCAILRSGFYKLRAGGGERRRCRRGGVAEHRNRQKGAAEEACAGVVRAESKGTSSLGAGSEVGLALSKSDL